MKGLVIFLVTLVMRKNQNYKICRIDIGGGRDNNNKKTTNLADFVLKYLNFHKNKINTKNISNESHKEKNNIQNMINTNTGNNIKNPKILAPIIQKGENFTINNNDLFQNLKTNSNYNDESFRENLNDLSMSFSRNFNGELDLKKGNSFSSINLFNSGIFLPQKK